MKKIIPVVALLSVGIWGCGSSSTSGTGGAGTGGPPDFASLESRLSSPSGTFSPGQETAVQDGFASQSKAATEGGGAFGGGSGSSSTKSTGLSAQGLAPQAEIDCPQARSGGKGTCSCPSGGSIEFDVPSQSTAGQSSNGTIDQTMSVVARGCATSDQTLDGSMYLKIKNPPPLQIFSLHMVVTGKNAGKYDVDYMLKDGMLTFAVDVADGRVLVSAKGNWNSATKTGTLTITDKNETWTCNMTNGKGSCSSSKGGSRQVG